MSPLQTHRVVLAIAIIPLLLQGTSEHKQHQISKRMLPDNQSCDPSSRGTCSKGDFVDKALADCSYETTLDLGTCTASGKTGGIISWVVAPDKDNKCKPIVNGKKFTCGAQGTNTRCVCNDYKIELNECRCQYWTEETPGSQDPAFCTAYYLAGDSKVHHYACCNNCKDENITSSRPESSDWKACDSHTYEGGSSSDYCNSCGESTGGGLIKYYFNCGSCEVQTHCEARCNHTTGLRLPGFCWKWVNCFKGCCVATMKAVAQRNRLRSTKHELKKRYNEMDIGEDERVVPAVNFCGDGICSASESRFTCPADCCSLVNSKCSSTPSECTDSCCQMDSCCLESI